MRHLRVFKRAIDSQWLENFESLCRHWFAEFETRAADPSEAATYPIVARFPKQSGLPLSPALYDQTKPPAGIEEFFGVIAGMPIWPDLVDGRALYLLRDYCSVRRQKSLEIAKGLGWHQDSAVIAGVVRARGVSGYVLWVPITPIDRETPTLQVMPYWRWPLTHLSNKDNGYLESIHRPWGPIVTLDHMERGDVALFDINCPHRSLVKPKMVKDRLSVDLRVVRTVPQSYRGEAIPLGQ
jgi:hypothetical protein